MTKHAVETRWLREFAKTYLPCDSWAELNASALRRDDISIVDLMCFFRRGQVIYTDKQDCEGTKWVVRGVDCDDRPIIATLLVHTQEHLVKLKKIRRTDQTLGPHNDAA